MRWNRIFEYDSPLMSGGAQVLLTRVVRWLLFISNNVCLHTFISIDGISVITPWIPGRHPSD